MTASLLTFLIFITIELSIVLFFVYQLWQHTYTNLDNQVKMRKELIHLLEQNNSILKAAQIAYEEGIPFLSDLRKHIEVTDTKDYRAFMSNSAIAEKKWQKKNKI